MAKNSSIEKNNAAASWWPQYAAKRAALKAVAKDQSLPLEERFGAQLKLAELPRNSSPRSASATAAKSRAVRAATTASSG